MNVSAKTRPLDRAAALLAGVCITALLTVAMGWLNQEARARSESDPGLRRVLVLPPAPPMEPRRPAAPPKPRKARNLSLSAKLPDMDFTDLGLAALDVPQGRGHSAQTPMDAADADMPPRRVSGKRPRYPRSARRRGIEGAVKLRMLIDDRGAMRRAEILETRGHPGFREAVLNAVRSWTFSPAISEGNPVWVWATTTVRFELDD